MEKEAQIIISDESFVGVMSIMYYYIQQLIINIITSATNASDIILPKLHLATMTIQGIYINSIFIL